MSIQKLRSGRVPTATASTYIGEAGTIFWNSSTGEFRLSDGVTPGGHPTIPAARVSTTQPTNLAEGQFWLNPTTYELSVYHNGAILPTIDVATPTKLGGIKLGPGVTVNGQDQLIVDSAGLDFSFGDFYAFTNPGPSDGACLSSVNENQDVNIVSNGTGMINAVGAFHVHKTDETVEGALSVDPIFEVNADGQTFIRVPTTDSTLGAVEIIGSSTGTSISPGLTGAMLHVTGQIGTQNRSYFDGNGGYVSLVARRWNGTIAGGRTQVKAGDDVLRINATAQTDTTMPSTAIAQIALKALEDQTDTAQGSQIEFIVTPVGQPTSTRLTAASINSTGTTSIRFFGPLTGNVTGDVSGNAGTVTNGVYINGSYSDPSWLTLSATKVGLGNVTNESKATMFSSPTFTGTVSGVTKAMVGLGSVENTALSTWAGSSNLITTGTLTELVVAGTMRYDIAQNHATAVQPATPSNVKTNAVTANGRSGQITTNTGSIGNGASATFTVNNTSVSAHDIVHISVQSGATADSYNFTVIGTRANAFDIQICNYGNQSRSDAIVFNFAVIKVS